MYDFSNVTMSNTVSITDGNYKNYDDHKDEDADSNNADNENNNDNDGGPCMTMTLNSGTKRRFQQKKNNKTKQFIVNFHNK